MSRFYQAVLRSLFILGGFVASFQANLIAQGYTYKIVAREGMSVDGQTINAFTGISVNDLGEVAFRANFPFGAGIVSTRTGLVARSTQVVNGRQLSDFYGTPAINNQGQVAYAVTQVNPSGFLVLIDRTPVVVPGQLIDGVQPINTRPTVLSIDDNGIVFFALPNQTHAFTQYARVLHLPQTIDGISVCCTVRVVRNIAGDLLFDAKDGAGFSIGIFSLEHRVVANNPSSFAAAVIGFTHDRRPVHMRPRFVPGTGNVTDLFINNILTSTLPFTLASRVTNAGDGTIVFIPQLVNAVRTQFGLVATGGQVVDGATINTVQEAVISENGVIAFRATFADGSRGIVLASSAVQQATPQTLPSASCGQPYAVTLDSLGGVLPIRWSLQPGSILPSGFNLTNTGTISSSGLPAMPGSYGFTILATDSAQPPTTQGRDYVLTVEPSGQSGCSPPPPLRILQTQLPEARIALSGASQMETVSATGGVPPYSWKLREINQQTPARLSLASTSTGSATVGIAGMVGSSPALPPLKFGTYTVSIEVTDSAPAPVSVSQLFTYKVSCGVNVDDDTDKDGLTDCWELGGIDVDGDGTAELNPASLLTPPETTSPIVRDLFIELDWMAPHRPSFETVVKPIQLAFADAPSGRINAHFIYSNQVESDPLLTKDKYAEIKRQYFGQSTDATAILEAKRRFMRYVLIAHRWADGSGTAGISEPQGDDIAIFPDVYDQVRNQQGHPIGKDEDQAGNLMHEIGHTLGLKHGGGDEVNCKPNYLSVMNYAYTETNLVPSRRLDYSRYKLPVIGSLVENALDERTGLGAGIDPRIVGYLQNQKIVFGPLSFLGSPNVANAGGPIDWNRNGASTDPSASADLNRLINLVVFREACDGDGSLLEGYDDWSNLKFKFDPTLTTDTAGIRSGPNTDWLRAISPDTDGDGLKNIDDNCPVNPNPDQADTNGDGKGDACQNPVPGDANKDGAVTCDDLAMIRNVLGRRAGELGWDRQADLNGDSVIDARDLQIVARTIPAGTVCR